MGYIGGVLQGNCDTTVKVWFGVASRNTGSTDTAASAGFGVSANTAFRDLGRENKDIPAAARVVKAYLRDVMNEQLMVVLVPEQATPVFSA
jgi:hypothetical protein